MPDWNQVLEEIQKYGSVGPHDSIRRKYLTKLHNKTGRNVIAYYSGWLQKPGIDKAQINDDDKNGFMTTIHQLDRSKGLDLIIHTPGGNIAATESLVDYLKKMFGTDIRAIVPQIAMSAGTMMACACKEIVMGKQSSLGPIDPQFNGIPCYGVIAEFDRAISEIKQHPESIPIWQAIVGKYHPSFLGECQHAIDWSAKMVTQWLKEGMFEDCPGAEMKAAYIVEQLQNHAEQKTHERHLNIDDCSSLGLKIVPLEEDNELQDLVLTVHHAYMHTMASSLAIKIIENHDGQAICYQQQPTMQNPGIIGVVSS